MAAWLRAFLARFMGPVGTRTSFPSHLQNTRRLLIRVNASLKSGPLRVRLAVAIALNPFRVGIRSPHPPVESRFGLVAVYVATRPTSL